MEEVQLKIRLPAKLKQQLDRAAAQSNRSLSGEVVTRLEESFEFGDRVVSLHLQLSGAYTLSEQAEKMCREGLEELLDAERQGLPWRPTSNQAATRAEEIERARNAVAYFEEDMRKQRLLLREIATRDAVGDQMSAREIRERMKELKLGIA